LGKDVEARRSAGNPKIRGESREKKEKGWETAGQNTNQSPGPADR